MALAAANALLKTSMPLGMDNRQTCNTASSTSLPCLLLNGSVVLQVMLAQQRTIIQLVELVNVLHDEAARLVASLTRSNRPPGSPSKHDEVEQQDDAQQQMAHERYGSITCQVTACCTVKNTMPLSHSSEVRHAVVCM
jgi:hypothetical protein